MRKTPKTTGRSKVLTLDAAHVITADWVTRLRRKVAGADINCQVPTSLMTGGGRVSLPDDIRRVIAEALDGLLDESSGLDWMSARGKTAARHIDPMLNILLDFGGNWFDGNTIGEKAIAIAGRLWRMSGGSIDNSGGAMAAKILGDDDPYTHLSDGVRDRLVAAVLAELRYDGVFENNCLDDILMDAFQDSRKAGVPTSCSRAWRALIGLNNGELAEALVDGWGRLRRPLAEHEMARGVHPETTATMDRAMNRISEFLDSDQIDRLLGRWPDLRIFNGFDIHWERSVLRESAAQGGHKNPQRSF